MKTKKSKQQRAANGSVTVEIRGKALGLRLPERHFGTQRYFALLLPNSPECRAIAELKAKELELELALGKFDGNLEKFRPPVAPTLPAQPKISLGMAELWQEYASAKRSQISPSTWKSNYMVISSHSQRCPIQELSRAVDIGDWAIANLTSDSAERFLMQVNAACKWAARRGKIASNPFEGYREDLVKSKKTKQAPKVFYEHERLAIIQAFEELKPELLPLIKFYFLTGCRTGEALALRWIDVSPDGCKLSFSKNLVIGAGGEILKEQGKTGVRDFPCNQQLQALLNELGDRKLDDRIFPFSHQILRNAWAGKKREGIIYSLERKGKIREYLPQYHTRHTFITTCLTQGIAIQELAHWVGNSPEIILKRYAGVIRNVQVPEI